MYCYQMTCDWYQNLYPVCLEYSVKLNYLLCLRFLFQIDNAYDKLIMIAYQYHLYKVSNLGPCALSPQNPLKSQNSCDDRKRTTIESLSTNFTLTSVEGLSLMSTKPLQIEPLQYQRSVVPYLPPAQQRIRAYSDVTRQYQYNTRPIWVVTLV